MASPARELDSTTSSGSRCRRPDLHTWRIDSIATGSKPEMVSPLQAKPEGTDTSNCSRLPDISPPFKDFKSPPLLGAGVTRDKHGATALCLNGHILFGREDPKKTKYGMWSTPPRKKWGPGEVNQETESILDKMAEWVLQWSHRR